MSDEILDPDALSDAEWLPVRATLRDIAVPAEARESAIGAALAAFDEIHGTMHVEVPAAAAAAASLPGVADDRGGNVVSLQTRMGSRWTRWVGSAAAAVAVLAVGGVVINGLGRSSNDQVSIDATTAVESALSTDTAKMSDAAGMNATDMEPTSGGVESGGSPVPESTISSIDGGAIAETVPAQVVTAMAPTEAVADPDGLADYATRTAAAPPMAALPDSACRPDGAETIGVITFQGATAIVVRNPDSSYSAISADTCAVLATVTP